MTKKRTYTVPTVQVYHFEAEKLLASSLERKSEYSNSEQFSNRKSIWDSENWAKGEEE